jgi:hypothetical protein
VFLRLLVALAAVAPAAPAQVYADNLPVDHPAIRYFQNPLDDPVARLSKRIGSGEVKLPFREGGLGFLPGLLEALGVNPDSQALVFSKTSFQASKISPRNPRAIYFGDNVAVGFVPGGEELEVAALDPKQGIVFYTLDARKPEFTRRDTCLKCHQGPATMGVPGIFVGSVFPNSAGSPSASGAIITDHRTPFADRWGGWYVNSTRGEQKDRANSVAFNPAEPEALEALPKLAAASYLTPSSDIVALMTFEHQTQMLNLITRLGWEARMGAPQAELDSAVNATVDYMLFTGEPPLKEPIEGVSTFTKTFPDRGPRDRMGRSLRDFDLQQRLFRYPLSYLIYSESFDALPNSVREPVYKRLYSILTSEGSRLTQEDRQAILEILCDTKPNLPAYWHAKGR